MRESYTFPCAKASTSTVAKTVAEIQGWATSTAGTPTVRRAPRRGTVAWREQLQLRKAKLTGDASLHTLTEETRARKEGPRPAATPRRKGMSPAHSISPASRYRRSGDGDQTPEAKPAFGIRVRDTRASALRKQRAAATTTAPAARPAVLLRPTACCNYYCSAVREQVLKQKVSAVKRHAKLTVGPPFAGLSPHARRVARAEWMQHKGRYQFCPEDDSLPAYNRTGGPPCSEYISSPTGTKRFNLRLVKQRAGEFILFTVTFPPVNAADNLT